jgi:predicted SnoaL-like aldol condensation-catalyzing enzyme
MQEDKIMTNKEKALALINTFASGDTEKAKELLAPGYIQHNLLGYTEDGKPVTVKGNLYIHKTHICLLRLYS